MGKVIIDGVNVSECDRLRTYRDWTYSSDKWCGISNDGGCECEQNPNCYYKQLQRLKAENETLERTNNELRKRFSEDTTKLSAELKELKADIESRTMCITCERELQNCNLQAENERLKEENEKLNKMTGIFSARLCEKYRQALQEIREYCEEQNLKADYTACEIIDKINKVIGE